jgi:hypothetical protein
MNGNLTQDAQKEVQRRQAVFKRYNYLWGEMLDLEKEVLTTMGEDNPITETIQMVCTHMMNGNIELEDALYEKLPTQNQIEETTLNQLLDVLTMIKTSGPRSFDETRSATASSSALIARAYGVEKQTICDIWVRRLDLPSQTKEFNELVFEWLSGKPDKLCQVIKIHIDVRLHPKINEFFSRPASVEKKN